MGTNIIKFSDILLKASEKPGDREAILDVVVRPSITEVLQEAGLDPQKFSAVDCSIQRFWSCRSHTRKKTILSAAYTMTAVRLMRSIV